MSLADALRDAQRIPNRVATRMTQVMTELEKDDPVALAEFKKALADEDRISAHALSRLMTDNGYAISAGTILKHRHSMAKA